MLKGREQIVARQGRVKFGRS